MPFIEGDKNINRSGRPKADRLVNPKSVSKETLREKELKQILRRVKPLNNKALDKIQTLLEDDSTTESGKIKLAVFLMKTYQDIIDELYAPVVAKVDDKDEDDEKDKETTPTVSFKMIQGGKSNN